MQRRIAVDEQVVLHDAVPPSADECGSRYPIEQVAGDLRSAEHIVQVDPHTSAPLEAVDVVHVVVADDGAAHGPVAAGIDGPGVVRLVANAVDFVQFDEVIVATEPHAHVRGVVNQVVRGTIADPLQRDARPVDSLPAGVVMDVIVLGEMPGGGKRLAVASGQRDAAGADLVDVAADYAMVEAS